MEQLPRWTFVTQMLGGALTFSPVRARCGGRILHAAVFGLDGTKNFSGRDYIDPLGAEKLGDGRLRARRITDKEAFKLYGNT
jgi:hypothetical protein